MKPTLKRILQACKRFTGLSLVLATLFCVVLFAASNSYESGDDPLVTLSYLEKVFGPELKEAISTELKPALTTSISADLREQLTSSLTGTISDRVRSQLSSEFTKTIRDEIKKQIQNVEIEIPEPEGETYEPVTFQKGDRVIMLGVCEIMLKEGDAVAICTNSESGLYDLTSGAILHNGYIICRIHHILIENGDSRGFEVTSDTATFLIKGGEYILEEQE